MKVELYNYDFKNKFDFHGKVLFPKLFNQIPFRQEDNNNGSFINFLFFFSCRSFVLKKLFLTSDFE